MIFTNKDAYGESKMSVSKVKHEYKIILDFSDQKLTKTHVRKSLKDINIEPLYPVKDDNLMVCIENEIKVGMYKISLVLSPTITRFTSHKLKDFGDFNVQIFEDGNRNSREINLSKDNRFKEQYWAQKNSCGLKVIDLTDIICHFKRLDKLRAFL
jgi:hypothetical protein